MSPRLAGGALAIAVSAAAGLLGSTVLAAPVTSEDC